MEDIVAGANATVQAVGACLLDFLALCVFSIGDSLCVWQGDLVVQVSLHCSCVI